MNRCPTCRTATDKAEECARCQKWAGMSDKEKAAKLRDVARQYPNEKHPNRLKLLEKAEILLGTN